MVAFLLSNRHLNQGLKKCMRWNIPSALCTVKFTAVGLKDYIEFDISLQAVSKIHLTRMKRLTPSCVS